MVIVRRRRKRRIFSDRGSFTRDTVGLTTGGIISGVGASVVTSVGGEVGGISAFSSYYPITGSIAGAGMVLSQTKKLARRSRKLY